MYYLVEYTAAKNAIKNSELLGLTFAKEIFQLSQLKSENSYSIIVDKFFNGNLQADEAIECLLDEVIYHLENDLRVDWKRATVFLGRNEVFPILERMQYSISDEDYWMLLGFCYTMSDFCFNDYETLKKFFSAERSKRECVMNLRERKFLSSLPDSFTIYRGCSKKEIESGQLRISWTLDKKVAKFFAHKYWRNFDLDCQIIERVVVKSDVLAYFGGRKEKEILLIPK